MRHSCGHKAPSDLPKDAVRNMPKCIGCYVAKQNEQLDKLRELRRQQAADAIDTSDVDGEYAAAYDVFDLRYD